MKLIRLKFDGHKSTIDFYERAVKSAVIASDGELMITVQRYVTMEYAIERLGKHVKAQCFWMDTAAAEVALYIKAEREGLDHRKALRLLYAWVRRRSASLRPVSKLVSPANEDGWVSVKHAIYRLNDDQCSQIVKKRIRNRSENKKGGKK